MKKCTKCKQEKPLTDFYESNKYKDGLRCWCKKCLKDCATENHKKNIIKRFCNICNKNITETRQIKFCPTCRDQERKIARAAYLKKEYHRNPEFREKAKKRKRLWYLNKKELDQRLTELINNNKII